MQSPELHLWRFVLLTGLRATDADAWVRTPDFRMVCALARLDPDACREAWRAGRVVPAYAGPRRAVAA